MDRSRTLECAVLFRYGLIRACLITEFIVVFLFYRKLNELFINWCVSRPYLKLILTYDQIEFVLVLSYLFMLWSHKSVGVPVLPDDSWASFKQLRAFDQKRNELLFHLSHLPLHLYMAG